METCGTCGYMIIIGDPREAINECHCRPPTATDKGLAIYPRVRNNDPGCGEWTTMDPAKEREERPPALKTAARERKDKARAKALKR